MSVCLGLAVLVGLPLFPKGAEFIFEVLNFEKLLVMLITKKVQKTFRCDTILMIA